VSPVGDPYPGAVIDVRSPATGDVIGDVAEAVKRAAVRWQRRDCMPWNDSRVRRMISRVFHVQRTVTVIEQVT
jgi:hypothetical protein